MSRMMLNALLLPCMLAGCATAPRSQDALAARVSTLVDRTVIPGGEQLAFTELEAPGTPAVPYIVGHLGDMRPLPEAELSLSNTSPTAFEGARHYSPETVHDALAAILNQLTGQNFAFVYNGASVHERQVNAAQWQAWCVGNFPTKVSVCASP